MNLNSGNIKLFVSLLFLLVIVIACAPEPEDPDPDSETYRQAVSNFYVSLAAAQTDEMLFAFNKMDEVAKAYPSEPAAWVNLGVYAMRQGNFELSSDRFEKALELMPDHPDVLFLAGLLESRRGNIEQAIHHFRKGSDQAPENLMITFALVRELERQNDIANAAEITDLLKEMHYTAPENQVIIFELARVAAKEHNRELLVESLEKLNEFSGQWDEDVIEQSGIVKDAALAEEFSEVSIELSFFRNGIEPVPSFQDDLRQVQLAPNEVGYLIHEFLWLPMPQFRASEPDFELSFTEFEGDEFPFADQAAFVTSVTLLEEMPPIAIYMQGRELVIDEMISLEYPGDVEYGIVLPNHILAEIDYNYNFMKDLALAGNRGFRLYRQNEGFSFTDVTAELNLPNDLIHDSYNGVWAADLDQDGDLDLILGRENREPIVLRNNADGSFTRIELFPDLENIVDFIWADLDGTGTGDALFLTADGDLKLYRNLRHGRFLKSDHLPVDSGISAIEVADLNADGQFDIVMVARNNISRLYYERKKNRWIEEHVMDHQFGIDQLIPGATNLFISDLDNNGVLDILLSGIDLSSLWLADENFNYNKVDVTLPGGVVSVFDIDGNERLDLLGIERDGQTFRLMNNGSKAYNARSIRARASGLEGDQRINSYGIGGEMEVRSGLLYQKRRISSPIVHFGLGEYVDTEMLRITWPNGSVQAEFAELGIGETIFNEQILKGSCPWLFTHNGDEIQFITDALWRSPLGLRINAQETAGVIQTYDRVRIPGNKLASRDGVYDVRITAELWETHFFDYVDLVAVDHPSGTEVYVDERFVFPPPDLSTRIMSTPESVARVTDQEGHDVTDIISKRDGNYLKAFEKTSYQGLVHDHFIEVEIGKKAPVGKPLYLLMSGWLRPTDSSINLALSQGGTEPPRGLMVEVSDGEGGWKTLHNDYGVPAGKTKTILLELGGDAFPSPSDRRLRLHTTSEIYWDAIQWAEALPDDMFEEHSLNPVRQELRYRGYSEWFRPDSVSPKLPDYSNISGTVARWRDLEGYHTRFGDVSELLAKIDDRYVIMNAGDELLLEFEAIDPPQDGWTRSYIFISDGWVKDGDYNTEASRTVEPLPYHGQTDYDYSSESSLRKDPVYLKHRDDWKNYHTRYVTPEPFRSALLFHQGLNNTGNN